MLLQRRKKYKNRPIPGGFKTIAVGTVNLTEVVQSPIGHELLLYPEDSKDDSFYAQQGLHLFVCRLISSQLFEIIVRFFLPLF